MKISFLGNDLLLLFFEAIRLNSLDELMKNSINDKM